jgi:hypothetical protein
VTQTGTIDAIKVRHSGNVRDKVIEGTYKVSNEAERALVAPQDWSTHILNRDEQLALAEAAHVLRFGDADGNVDTPIQPQKMLGIRRTDDRSNDLWTTWNVVQENTIKGGLRGQGRDDLGRHAPC